MSNYRRVFIQNSCVFLTIITHKRKHILIDNIELLRESFKNVNKLYDYEIVACVILPEHMHVILNLKRIEDYPKIISAIKHYFSRKLGIKADDLTDSKIKKREKGIWHRRYFEHTIIDEIDLNKHIDYVHYNPVKHGHVTNVKDWKYSTFHKFVKANMYDFNWGNNEERKSFCDLYGEFDLD